MRASANVHPVSVRTHRGDNHTDECNKTSNTPEEASGELWLMASPTTPCRMDNTILSVDHRWEGGFTGRLTLEELSQSAQAIVRSVQNECFPEDVEEVSQNKEVKISSRLRSIRPLLETGLLRVGGRLQKAVVLSLDEKHPMILPKHHLKNEC